MKRGRRRAAAAAAALVGAAVAIYVLLAAPPEAVQAPPAPPPEDEDRPPLSAHRRGGDVAVPTEWTGLAPSLFPVRDVQSAEPTIGADADGALYVGGESPLVVWKSTDRGKTWTNVLRELAPDRDPYLWVDRDAGRVWSAPLVAPCKDIKWSDDGGRTWSSSPRLLPTDTLCGGGQDHPSLVTGPVPAGVSSSYGRVAYYTYNLPPAGGGWVTRSLDGGASWSAPLRVFDGSCQGGYMGATAVAPDGTAYIPKPGCDDLSVAVSTDGGTTWQSTAVRGAGMAGTPGDPVRGRPETFWTNPAAATDPAGDVFVAWGGDDGRIHLSRSADGGRSWSAPAPVSPPWLNSTAFSAMAALGEGRVAVAYLGTEHPSWNGREAHDAPPTAEWHLYVTFTYEARSEDPLFVTLRATLADDPVQRGCIWQGGLGATQCRNLRDFIGATESKGSVFVAFSDGCPPPSPCPDSTRSAAHALHVARVDGLPPAPVPPTPTPAPGIRVPVPGAAVALLAVAAALLAARRRD